VSRSKRLNGVANAAPPGCGHLAVAAHFHSPSCSSRSSSFSWFLMYSRITVSSRPTVDTKYPLAQKVLTHKVAPSLCVHPCKVNRTLAFDVPHYLRHRVLRRYLHQHVNMVRHQVPFQYPALPLLGQSVEDIPQIISQFPIQGLASTFWNKHHVVLALPFRVIQTCIFVHRVSFFRVLGGSRLKVTTMDTPRKVKPLLPPRQSRGNSQIS